MNIDTGKIRHLNEGESPNEREILVNEADMTKKQLEQKLVSLHDNRSKLGKARIKARRSKYMPHVGKKELKRLEATSDE